MEFALPGAVAPPALRPAMKKDSAACGGRSQKGTFPGRHISDQRLYSTVSHAHRRPTRCLPGAAAGKGDCANRSTCCSAGSSGVQAAPEYPGEQKHVPWPGIPDGLMHTPLR